MSNLCNSYFPPPKGWDAFEEIVYDSYTEKLRNPNLKRFGRQGQSQHGVDIVCSFSDNQITGVQCKNHPDSKIVSSEIDDEISKAESFRPALRHYIIATSAKRDKNLTSYVMGLSSNRRAAGKFTVEIEFWEDICQTITKHPKLIKRHYPDIPLATELLHATPSDLFSVGRKTATAFISYSRKDQTYAELLQEQLKIHGVNPWRDITHLNRGKLTDEEITRGIEQSDIFILLATPNSLNSDYIWNLEIPSALNKSKLDNNYSIYPLFVGISPSEFHSYCSKRSLIQITDYSGDSYDPTSDSDEKKFFKTVCFHALKSSVNHAIAAHNIDTEGYKPALSIRSFADGSFRGIVDLDIDLTLLLCGEGNDSEDISSKLIPAFNDIQKALNELHCDKEITVYIKSRLATGLIFGWTFRNVTGYTLRIALTKGACWSTDDPAVEAPIDENQNTFGKGDEAIIILNLTSSNDIEKSVITYANTEKINYGPVINFRLNCQFIENGAQALAIATRIAKRIKNLNVTQDAKVTHIFGMMPAPLAVLIGHHLNSCGPIAFYYSNPNNTFTKSALFNT